ncbi:hypothetical protein CYMTET_45501 [Cymbomonas tetramitiformis]|uniref:Uncharacterized protein n=1 Tax=Cymbomonas tetramitiformis TaxID=36881 RepID=A0AAE0BZE0_9CHLO|nr:hypothetical protein CYMTET_45501 [Cymbomonas tetramitiformis]
MLRGQEANGECRWARSAEGTLQGDPLGLFLMVAMLHPIGAGGVAELMGACVEAHSVVRGGRGLAPVPKGARRDSIAGTPSCRWLGLGDGGCESSQRAGAGGGANTTVRARLLSLSRDGATWHLNALPEDGGFRLKPIAAVLSLYLQLGVMLPLGWGVSVMGAGQSACGGEVDEVGHHDLARNRGGMFTHRHDAVLLERRCKVVDLASVNKTHVHL